MLFKYFCGLLLLVMTPVGAWEEVSDAVVLNGKLQFITLDNRGKMRLGKYINSPRELTSASVCSLQVSAYDEENNVYSADLNLVVFDGDVSPYFQVKSYHLSDDGRYHKRGITQAEFDIASLHINASIWHQELVKGTYMLISPGVESGQLAFHHLTMGQPLTVKLTREISPHNVVINVAPISAKRASIVRQCLKLMDEHL